MKKLLAWVLMAVMLLGMVGCGAQPAPEAPAAPAENQAAAPAAPATPEDKGTLTIWVSKVFSDDANAAIRERALAFGEANNVEIVIEEISATNLTNVVNAAVEAGVSVLPDVILWSSYGKFMYYYPELLNTDVTDLFNEINGAHPFLGARKDDSLIVDGVQYAIPFYCSPTLMYIRKDAMEAAGVTEVPTTWEETFELAKKITEATDLYGLGWGCGPNDEDGENNTRMMMWSQGAFLLSEDGLNDSDLYKQWCEAYVQMYNDGVIPVDATTWNASGNNKSYLAGESAICFNASTLTRSMKMDNPELYANTIVTNMPTTADTHLYDCTSAWTIMKSSNNQEVAAEFLKWMVDYEWYEEFIKGCAPVFAPVYQEIADSDFWVNDSDNRANVEYATSADAMHSFPSKQGNMVAAGMQLYQTYEFNNVLVSMINGASFEDAWAAYEIVVADVLAANISQ